MSAKPPPPIAVEYNQGFKKPMGGEPFFMRALLRSEMMAAKVGAEAEVPDTGLIV